MKIAVGGTGYVGLSLAVLLSQHNDVIAVDIVADKVDLINSWKSPIADEYIEKYLSEHEERGLHIHATTDGDTAYADADFIIFAAPTNSVLQLWRIMPCQGFQELARELWQYTAEPYPGDYGKQQDTKGFYSGAGS